MFNLAKSQSFLTYTDTANRFSAGIPAGWKYGLNKTFPRIKLLAYRAPLNETDTSRDSFNVNIVETAGKELSATYPVFIKYISKAAGFQIIAEGDTTLNGTSFKWIVETHLNDKAGIPMHNYDLVGSKEGRTYILTMATFSYRFEEVKHLFDIIASSFLLLD